MSALKTLLSTFARPGRLDWIGLRPIRLADLVTPTQAEVTETGLSGDHGRPGKRAVTLIQAEHLRVIAALCQSGEIAPETLRRNLVISGINLNALRGQTIAIGAARLTLTGPCAPCSRMEKAFGAGGYNAMRGHGGWCAQVTQPGRICLGDPVTPAN